MKNLLLLALFSFISFFADAQTPGWQWAEDAAGNNNNSSATSVATDASGNVYVAGSFSGDSITFGSTTLTNDTTDGSDDIFLVKYDASGNVLWAKGAGGDNSDYPNAITTDALGNVYITGSFTSASLAFGTTTLINSTGLQDMFLVKYSSAGDVNWAKSVDAGANVISYSLTADASGSVYVAGFYLSSTVTFGSIMLTNNSTVNGSNIFLVKYDKAGNVKWAKSEGGDTRDYGFSVATAKDGVCLTGSYSSSSVTFGSTTLNNNAGAGTLNLYLVKYDTSGNVSWAKSAGSNDNIFSQQIAVDVSGNIYVSGFFYSTYFTFGTTTLTNNGIHDMFLVKYDSSGNALWAKNSITDASTYDASSAITTDKTGNVYVIGSFGSDSITFASTTLKAVSGANLFMLAYSTGGNLLWGQSAAGSGNSLASDALNNIYLAGNFDGSSISFGSVTLNNQGSSNNMFVAKYASTLTGIKSVSNSLDALTLFPNPSSGKFVIQLNGDNASGVIKVCDDMGRLVYQSFTGCLQAGNLLPVDLSAQPSGIYFTYLKSGENMTAQKIVISK